MLLLLPPSETKRDGGDGAKLDVAALAHPRLASRRRAVVRAVTQLAKSPDAMAAALRLGPKQMSEVARNAALTRSPTMHAIDRYTGVLYDGLSAGTLPAEARERAHEIVRIHSALLGPVAALDGIPAYRLSYDSRLPGLSLKNHWTDAVTRELGRSDGLLLDLRSGGYAALGPVAARGRSYTFKVLARGESGEMRALNHFNKKAKGEFTRSLLLAEDLPQTVEDLLSWASETGIELRHGLPGELELIV